MRPEPLCTVCLATRMPGAGNGPGSFCVRGVTALDVTARYRTEAGVPLLSAAECAAAFGIRARTVYEWRRRQYLAVRGLADDGTELYDAAEVAEVRATPGQRARLNMAA